MAAKDPPSLVDMSSEQWPDVASLTLEATYDELRRVHALDRIVNPRRAKQVDDEDEDGNDDAENTDHDDGDKDTDEDGNDEKASDGQSATGQDDPVAEAHARAVQLVDQRRTTLRTKAMDLSRRTIRPLSVLDLPLDILHGIFAYFEAPYMAAARIGRPREDSEDVRLRVQVVRRARLTCRLFHDLASPLLFPILKVGISQASLDLADGISRSPLLAAGVRVVCVSLDYRIKELAEDLWRFAESRKEILRNACRRCSYCEETWYLGGYDEDDDTVCEQPHRVYLQAMDNYSAIQRAWDKENENPQNDEDLAYRRVLRQGYEEYRQKHEEQFRLISDGSFVNSLAASMSRMPHASSLKLADGLDCYPTLYTSDTAVLNDTDALARLLVSPHDWEAIEKLDGGAELVPAKLLSELPIAIHRAGVGLRHLDVCCFPVRNNYSMVCPDRLDPANPAWTDLHAACQGLETFAFGRGGMNCLPIRKSHIPAEERAHIDNYLAAMLSGQRLEVVALHLRSFAFNDGQTDKRDHYRLSPVLASAEWPHAQDVTIMNVALDQADLEGLCNGLGYHMGNIYLCDMQLKSGSWSNALDALRDRLAPRCTQGMCKVSFYDLTGGEFGEPEVKETDPSDWMDSEDWDFDEQPLLVQLSEKYVKGEVEENPLKPVKAKARVAVVDTA